MLKLLWDEISGENHVKALLARHEAQAKLLALVFLSMYPPPIQCDKHPLGASRGT